jgi:glycerol-3-phosphate acyltransferase PlsY
VPTLAAVAARSGSVLALAAAAATGYTVGTFSSADVATRVATGGTTDLRHAGTGNPGSANALLVLGQRWAYAIALADAAKAAVGCAVGRRLAGDLGAHVAGTAAVVGHCFPAGRGFRGGKGVAASAGQCFATFPVWFPADLAVAYGMARWRRRTMTATVVASSAWVAAATLWWRRGWPNAWGPRPSAALPLFAAATSAIVLSRFVAEPPPAPSRPSP